MGRKTRKFEKEYYSEYSDSSEDEIDIEREESVKKERRYKELFDIWFDMKRYSEKIGYSFFAKSRSMIDLAEILEENVTNFPVRFDTTLKQLDPECVDDFKKWKKENVEPLCVLYSKIYNSSFSDRIDFISFTIFVYNFSSHF